MERLLERIKTFVLVLFSSNFSNQERKVCAHHTHTHTPPPIEIRQHELCMAPNTTFRFLNILAGHI